MLTKMFRLLTPAVMGLLLACGSLMAHAQVGNLLGTDTFKSPQTEARLLVHAPQGIGPGLPVWAGLQISHAPKWHTYWLNSGDSGLPTQLTWQLPSGVTHGDIAWPTPKKFMLGPLANYGYDGTVLLVVPLQVSASPPSAQFSLELKASWLVCKTECIPEEATLRTQVPTAASTATHGQRFEAALESQPKNIAANNSTASVEGQFISISSADFPPAWHGKSLEFFPHNTGIIEPGAPWTQTWKDGIWHARLPLTSLRTDEPATLTAVVASSQGIKPGEQAAAGIQMTLPIRGTWPPVIDPATVGHPASSTASNPALANGGQDTSSATGQQTGVAGWVLAMAGAFIGGLLLNLMPCVFPVLSIKVLAFAQHGTPSALPRAQSPHLATGLAYTAGVVLSFLALGGLLLGLRATGEQLGWGFQLQSPVVVTGLAVLFTLIGLNLLGTFEVGNLLPSSVASAQAKHPTTDAFLTGVLATAVASPCTAPFMGASLGLAIGMPAAQALAVFAAIGLGMAAPYLLASWSPAITRWLPRPGAWMVTFKQFMAFPMFATVVWLVWVLGHQTGIDGASALLALLVTLSLAVWAWGLPARHRAWHRGLAAAGLAAAVVTLGPLSWTLPAQEAASPTPASVTGAAPATTASTWQAWSPGQVTALTDAGHTVFVDFTAAWCVTCQFNKRTTLDDRQLLADMAARQVRLLRADWTRRDPAITAALAELGRNGVPTYAVYRPGRPPAVLSEILSVKEVRTALELD